ncbi:MAG: NADPH-dependent F420 reductase [Actinomycetota bacterium]|nr:NADPH-dependent F420 reductase [Actinomycetota bacterium]
METIGVLGGTGPAGVALGKRFAKIGHQVTLGSRDKSRAIEKVAEVCGEYQELQGLVVGGSNEEAASCDIVVVATPWEGAEATIRPLKASLDGKIVISMVNALLKVGPSLHPYLPPRGSVTAQIQAALPTSKVVGAFHHAPAKELGEIHHGLDCDIMVVSDHKEAREAVVALIDQIPGARGIDAGTNVSAGAIESMTAVLININIKYKTRSSIRLSGLEK